MKKMTKLLCVILALAMMLLCLSAWRLFRGAR